MGLDLQGHYRYPPPNPAWLALHREPILEPERPIIDAHHHLWQEPGNPYLAADLAADIGSGHTVVASVFVQCHWNYREGGPAHLRSVGEVESVARACPHETGGAKLAAGIVGFADLSQPALLDEALDAFAAAAPGRFCGVRHSLARDSHFPDGIVIRPAPDGLMQDGAFRNGLRCLGTRGYVFDAMIYHQQLPALASLAGAAPDTPIILDHIGCPLGVGPYEGQQDAVFAEWRNGLRALAQHPNVHVKFGGLGMIILGATWHLAPAPPGSLQLAAAWRRYFEACLEAFGPGRCLFEGNFPVDKAMFSHAVLWNAFKRLAMDLSSDEKTALFAGNAQRLYGLRL